MSSRKAGPGSTVLYRTIGKSPSNHEVRGQNRGPAGVVLPVEGELAASIRVLGRARGGGTRRAPGVHDFSLRGEAHEPAARPHRGTQVHVFGVEEVAFV